MEIRLNYIATIHRGSHAEREGVPLRLDWGQDSVEGRLLANCQLRHHPGHELNIPCGVECVEEDLSERATGQQYRPAASRTHRHGVGLKTGEQPVERLG